jgi:aspartate/methionine/tyrosine aminotransferase
LALGLLELCMRETHRLGLDEVVAAQVRKRRQTLRDGLAGSGLVVELGSHASLLPVEWMNCRAVGRRDLELTRLLHAQGISVLPGRNFYWASGTADEHHWNIRLAMMKPLIAFERSIEQLARACRAMQLV